MTLCNKGFRMQINSIVKYTDNTLWVVRYKYLNQIVVKGYRWNKLLFPDEFSTYMKYSPLYGLGSVVYIKELHTTGKITGFRITSVNTVVYLVSTGYMLAKCLFAEHELDRN